MQCYYLGAAFSNAAASARKCRAKTRAQLPRARAACALVLLAPPVPNVRSAHPWRRWQLCSLLAAFAPIADRRSLHSERNMASEDENAPKCDLEGDGCVRLSSILHAFGAPIREEQAWAVCYQTSKCMCKEWAADNRGCYCLTATSQLRIHKDGSVHTSTVRDLGPGKREFTSFFSS
ncbi:hypothetical protein HPB51_019982 [Rhipicephalus microplus]|uniref:KIND domain-containing protein n=1 Tax=Rhipicephalus microplus TaxID=6941 RepID=A0A9J6DC33_RHIMP|nr:hypothetical protein HPB51_019982 [Rhipicephalus microplus]